MRRGVVVVFLIKGTNKKDAVFFPRCKTILEGETRFKELYQNHVLVDSFLAFKIYADYYIYKTRRNSW